MSTVRSNPLGRKETAHPRPPLAAYERHQPEETALHTVVRGQLETFLAREGEGERAVHYRNGERYNRVGQVT